MTPRPPRGRHQGTGPGRRTRSAGCTPAVSTGLFTLSWTLFLPGMEPLSNPPNAFLKTQENPNFFKSQWNCSLLSSCLPPVSSHQTQAVQQQSTTSSVRQVGHTSSGPRSGPAGAERTAGSVPDRPSGHCQEGGRRPQQERLEAPKGSVGYCSKLPEDRPVDNRAQTSLCVGMCAHVPARAHALRHALLPRPNPQRLPARARPTFYKVSPAHRSTPLSGPCPHRRRHCDPSVSPGPLQVPGLRVHTTAGQFCPGAAPGKAWRPRGRQPPRSSSPCLVNTKLFLKPLK